MTIRGTRRAAVAAALLALAGCDTLPAASYHGYAGHAMYNARQLGAVREQGPVLVVVRSSPFAGVAPEALARTMAPWMNGANGGVPLQFAAEIPGPRAVDYRVVVVFGAAGVATAELCRVDRPPIEGIAGALRAAAAFCAGPARITEVAGDLRTMPSGPDDPAFRDFVRGLTRNLMPPYNWNLGPCRPGDC
jgi:hypothetical protein